MPLRGIDVSDDGRDRDRSWTSTSTAVLVIPPSGQIDVAERWSRVFDVVATAGSFTGAVRRLGLASPR
jgi:hypothetical protein